MDTICSVHQHCVTPLFTFLRNWQQQQQVDRTADSLAPSTGVSPTTQTIHTDLDGDQQRRSCGRRQPSRTFQRHTRTLLAAKDQLHRTRVGFLDALLVHVTEPFRQSLFIRLQTTRSILRTLSDLVAASLAFLAPLTLQALEITSRADQQLTSISSKDWTAGVTRLCRIATTHSCWFVHWSPTASGEPYGGPVGRLEARAPRMLPHRSHLWHRRCYCQRNGRKGLVVVV